MENTAQKGIVLQQKKNFLLKELFRKTIHLCSCFVPIFLKIAYWPVIGLLCFALVLYIISEILRMKGHPLPLIAKITEVAARKRDENKFVLGPVTLVCGILLAALILPWGYARVGIYALAFGDGLASLAGKTFGHIKLPGTKGKTLAGSLTCFAAVFISTLCCSKNPLVSFLVALCGMFIEALPLADFDNLIIPISIGSLYLLLINLL